MCLLSLSLTARGEGDFWKRLGLGKSGSPAQGLLASGLDNSQIDAGLKEALGNGVKQAINSLGKTDGFLKDLDARILMPESLRKVEKSMRLLGQGKMADEFVTTLNRAAEQAVPQAAEVLGNSVKQMSIADARTILSGTNNAATQYFRRTSETNLYARFLPIVQQATAATGVTSSYKQMVGKAGIAGQFIGSDAADLDSYVARKSMDGLFLKIAQEEKRIRENPAARTTDILQKVFGSATKK